MKITPKTEAEIAEEGLLPPGDYDFEVKSAEERQSKAGNDMLVLELKIFTDAGRVAFVTDYLLESNPRKLRGACEAVGLLDAYQAGEIMSDDFAGRAGRVRLKKEEGKGDFGPKNSVGSYLKPAADTAPTAPRAARAPAPPKGHPALDDEIPF